jgi:hypothetical protein
MVWVLMFLMIDTNGVPSQTPVRVYQTERGCQTASAKVHLHFPKRSEDGTVVHRATCLEVPIGADE